MQPNKDEKINTLASTSANIFENKRRLVNVKGEKLKFKVAKIQTSNN